jgi:hypothetical protein
MQPGAYIEQIEVEINARCDDDTRNPDSYIEKLANLSKDMGQAHGVDFRIAENMSSFMSEAGFTDIKEAKYKLPLGWWSADPRYKEIGKFYERYFKTGLQGWLMHILTKTMGVCKPSIADVGDGLTLYLQWSPEQVNENCLRAFAEIDSRQHHYYYYL